MWRHLRRRNPSLLCGAWKGGVRKRPSWWREIRFELFSRYCTKGWYCIGLTCWCDEIHCVGLVCVGVARVYFVEAHPYLTPRTNICTWSSGCERDWLRHIEETLVLFAIRQMYVLKIIGDKSKSSDDDPSYVKVCGWKKIYDWTRSLVLVRDWTRWFTRCLMA